jgi:MscS family membrane protein
MPMLPLPAGSGVWPRATGKHLKPRRSWWRRVQVRSCVLAALVVPSLTGVLGAQDSATARRDSAARQARAEVSPASPRASLEQFLVLAREGRYADAAGYLDLPDSLIAEGGRLARELKLVLDRHVWFDLNEISPAAAGDTTDGLAPNVEQVASIAGMSGGRQPVRMVREGEGEDARWRFTRATVERVPAWYTSLSDHWILDHLPDALLLPGPYELVRWQWLAIPLLLAFAWLVGSLASRIVLSFLGRLAARTQADWDDVILDRTGAPLTVASALALFGLVLPSLGLTPPAQASLYGWLRAALVLVLFWTLWRLVDVARDLVSRSAWARSAPSSRSLVPLGARTSKVVVLAIAGVAFLSLLGFPVASLIAGLGVGGLALALAAQKTVENLFGAFSIGVDQPFREGDFVKIDDFVGTVEAIGLRSTRFRTLDRTIVSLPNGKLADMRLESFTARDRLRLATVIGLVYETTAGQMREVLAGFERVLRAHPKIWPDAVVVRFQEFAASSLDIQIMAWFQTADWGEFQLIRQEILLQFMEVVEQAGSSIAFPTQTLHIASAPRPNGDRPNGAGERAPASASGGAPPR